MTDLNWNKIRMWLESIDPEGWTLEEFMYFVESMDDIEEEIEGGFPNGDQTE